MRTLVLPAAAALLLVGALPGCAVTGGAEQVTSSPDAGTPGQSAPPTGEPLPDPAVPPSDAPPTSSPPLSAPPREVAAPGEPRVPAACDDLVPATLLPLVTGQDVVAERPSDTEAPRDLVAAHVGLLQCWWRGDGASLNLSVQVDGEPALPDGRDAYTGEPLPGRTDTFADQSATE